MAEPTVLKCIQYLVHSVNFIQVVQYENATMQTYCGVTCRVPYFCASLRTFDILVKNIHFSFKIH